MEFDFLVVGSGITGATLARLLTDRGYKVLVLERRSRPGGNVHDYLHASGIRIHTYGPHYFRTSSEKIWAFVNRFSKFFPYKAQVKSLVDGELENWPVSASYVKKALTDPWQPAFKGVPANFEEACLNVMPSQIYYKFVKGYTEKQWGTSATNLSPDLVKRFDLREDDNPFLTPRHKYQGLPAEGYTTLINNMLDGIPLQLEFDYLKNKNLYTARQKIFFTGPIDEFFNFELGQLSYRGQQREHLFLPDVAYYQTVGQVNNPDPHNGSYIRTIEWKHMLPAEVAKNIQGTVITRETPLTPTDTQNYEYPFPSDINYALYRQYRELANRLPQVVFCGRLGEYRYYDMDQAIGRAINLAEKLTVF